MRSFVLFFVGTLFLVSLANAASTNSTLTTTKAERNYLSNSAPDSICLATGDPECDDVSAEFRVYLNNSYCVCDIPLLPGSQVLPMTGQQCTAYAIAHPSFSCHFEASVPNQATACALVKAGGFHFAMALECARRCEAVRDGQQVPGFCLPDGSFRYTDPQAGGGTSTPYCSSTVTKDCGPCWPLASSH